mmetsp:Transcript_16990/g.50709  ORF Transcript_16990/g.50709 Transcript_16990/m.50709 type:complete len:231 (-) Transcript_16990:617-1309(-)
MHNGGARRTSNPVVVRLAEAADGGDAGLGEEVHGQVRQPLLSDHHVRLEPRDGGAHPLDPLLFQLQQRRPVLFFGELHVGLVLALLVFQGAVHEQDARVVNFAPHATRRHDILIEHYAGEDPAIVQGAARDLLHLHVLLYVHFRLASVLSRHRHTPHRIQRQVRKQGAKARSVLGPDAAVQDLQHLPAVVRVYRERHGVYDGHRVLQRPVEAAHNDRRMQVPLQERLCHV